MLKFESINVIDLKMIMIQKFEHLFHSSHALDKRLSAFIELLMSNQDGNQSFIDVHLTSKFNTRVHHQYC